MRSTAVLVCPDAGCIALRALDLIVTELRTALDRRGQAHLALTGGSSAEALYRALRSEPRAQRVPWDRIDVWQGDERFTDPDGPESNWGLALRGWLAHPDGPRIPSERLHPMPVGEALEEGRDPEWVARRYARELKSRVLMRDGLPALDTILLGVGSDGHILSAFPDGEALDADADTVVAVPAPTHISPHLPRVTLVPRLLSAAALVIVMVPGASKAEVVADCFGPTFDPVRWPAQHAVRPNAVWLLDEACVEGSSLGQPGR